MDIRIGTCGYSRYPAPEGWEETYESKLQAYTDAYRTVELNQTFYKLPEVPTAEEWRRSALVPFDFAVKAWQAITHRSRSPTWNRYRDRLSRQQKKEFGELRPNESNLEAWERTHEIVRVLEAPVVLIQCPPSFGPESENVENMRRFFDEIDRDGVAVAWEPRGDWKDERELVGDLCAELDLVHVVDPLRNRPADDGSLAYLRLHGLNDDTYDYDYSDAELEELADRLHEWAGDRETIFCMFNNHEKFENADRLRSIL